MLFSLLWYQVLVLLPTVLSSPLNQCILVPITGNFNPETTTVPFNNKSFTVIKMQRSDLLHYIVQGISQDQVYIANCSEIAGVIGEMDSKTADIVHTLVSRLDLNIAIVSVIAPTTFLPLVSVNLPNVLDMNPLMNYIQTLISFIDQLNWTRVGLVSDGSYYYQSAAELLQKLLLQRERTFVPYVRVKENSNLRKVLQTILDRETQVIIISMKKLTACSLLEEARKMNLIWPNYGWLILDSETGSSIKSSCNLEGMIIIQDVSTKGSGIVGANNITFEGITSLVFLASISAVISTSKSNVHESFEGRTDLVKFRNGNRLNNISVIQVINGSELEIAHYDSNTEQLILNTDFLESDLPRGGILIIRSQNTIPHSVLFALLAFSCAVLVTVIFVLYLLFRKEPEIKATSVPISITMFIACYLLLSYIPVLLVKAYPDSEVSVPQIATCQFIAWIGGTGIPFPLILATILVKMLRICAIIHNPLSFKKKYFTDKMLLFYIVLLIFPTILILTLWSSIDPLIIVEIPFLTSRGQEVWELCLSTQTTAWIIIPYIYQAILIAAVVIIGLKTSSIRYKHFQDAGATNIFAFVAISSAFMGTIYGYLFAILQPSAENYVSSEITLSLSSMAIAISCMMLLFFPKVYYPLKRFLSRNEVKKKPATISTSLVLTNTMQTASVSSILT